MLSKIDGAIGITLGKAAATVNAEASRGGVRFYWEYCEQDDVANPVFTITPKDFFDANGFLSDEHFDETGFPPGFHNLMESSFEFDGSREDAEALLRGNPLFEEKEMFPA